MKLNTLNRRIQALEPHSCPRCQALKAMSEEEIDARLAAIAARRPLPKLPDPSPACPTCQADAAMTEEEIDAGITWLNEILQVEG